MSSTIITAIRGRRVWDSRGRPTVEAEITLAGGASGRAIAPAGASTGSGEALDKRDVERNRHLPPRREAGFFDGGNKGFQSLFIGGEGRPPATFICHTLQ